MALSIPIITEYVGTGLDKFKKELLQAETKSQKAGLVMQKAFLPASAAIGALAVGLLDATKGAMEDQAAQDLLASQLQKTTGATDKQIKSVEDYITQQGKLKGFTDSQLRPALEKLARAAGDVDEAQRLTNTAMDIATATGKPLETVVASLEKAYGGNMGAIQRLLPEYRDMIKEGATFEEVMGKVEAKLGGAASAAALTAEGRFKILKLQLDETKESIGAALLPAIEAVLPFLEKFAGWAQDNPDTFLIIAGALAAMAVSIMAINVAMALNPIGLIALGVIGLVAGVIALYKRFESVRTVIDAVFDGLSWYIKQGIQGFKDMVGVVKAVFNGIATAWNNTVGKLKFTVPGWVPGIGGKGFDMPDIPMLANGGIVKASPGGTLALIGEGGRDEAVIPLDRAGNLGGNTIHVHVQGADPNAVVDALRTYMFRNGSVPIRVS